MDLKFWCVLDIQAEMLSRQSDMQVGVQKMAWDVDTDLGVVDNIHAI